MFPFVLLSITLLYIAVAALYYAGIGRMKEPPSDGYPAPSVSLIIPARNEAAHLPGLFASLERLQYPSEKMEIILVDDRSSDATGRLMAEFCRGHASRIHLPLKHCPGDDTGKNNALTRAAERATGEFLFFTDADCRVPPRWITTTLACMQSGAGAVAGPVVACSFRDRGSLLSRLQSLDWALYSATGAVFSFFGVPLGMFGNNMCIRKTVYDMCGGFAKTKNRITEDYALFDLIRNTAGAPVHMHLHARGTILTASEPSLRQLIQQRIRWAWGMQGRTAPTFLLTALAFASVLGLLMGLITGHGKTAAGALLVMTGADVMLFTRIYNRLGVTPDRFALLCYKPYQLLLTVSAAVTFLSGRSRYWKESRY
ncbi:glycosyltransferase [bacterium]|nr:glycosyltransferase [bacterium]